MPSLRRVGAHWHIRFRDSRRVPNEVVVSLPAAAYTQAQARAHMRALDVDLARGVRDPWAPTRAATAQDVLTVAAAVEAYIEAKTATGARGERGGWSAATATHAATWYRTFSRTVGAHADVRSLTTADLAAVIFAPHLADATQRRHRRMIVAWVRWGRAAGVLDVAVPPARVGIRRLPAYATEDELRAIVAAHAEIDAERRATKHAPKHVNRLWMGDVFTFAFYTGLRIGELVALRVRSVDVAAGTIRVGDASFVTKTREEATIPLVPQVAALTAALVAGRGPDERLFGHTDTFRLSRSFKEAARRAVPDKPTLHFHSLRHSCAVYWRRHGVALEDIRDLLRHASITTTEIYEQMAPMDLRDRFTAAAGRSRESPPEPQPRKPLRRRGKAASE